MGAVILNSFLLKSLVLQNMRGRVHVQGCLSYVYNLACKFTKSEVVFTRYMFHNSDIWAGESFGY